MNDNTPEGFTLQYSQESKHSYYKMSVVRKADARTMYTTPALRRNTPYCVARLTNQAATWLGGYEVGVGEGILGEEEAQNTKINIHQPSAYKFDLIQELK